ncbi:NAD(P)-dependent oxidoreductase, partial [bacterium]|nr:NAD(P)-dependent oxidoreductase [bacterium]
GQPIAIRDVIEKVVKLVGSGRPNFGAYPYRPGENMGLYADISLAKNVLDWKPQTNLEEGLKKTVEYYRNSISGGQ